MNRGQVLAFVFQLRRVLSENDSLGALVGAAQNFVDRLLDIPKRDQRARNEPPRGGAAPLVEHPVVPGLQAEQPQIDVVALHERLSCEAGEAWEVERGD